MVKNTSLGHLKCWPLWAVDDKLVSILDVVCHRMIFWTRLRDRMLAIPLGLYHTGSEYPGSSPIFLVCVTPALKWTHRYCTLGASLIFERVFVVDECVACRLVVERAQILINYGLRCSSQYGITHVNYSIITLPHTIVNRFSLWDLLC